MLKYGNRDFRNLQEQVYANMKNIQDIIDGSNIIADFKTVNIVGQVEEATDLPDPDTYAGQYGDAILVGVEDEPADLYVFTKAYENENAPQWFNVGQFPLAGPQGPQGPQGEPGEGIKDASELLEFMEGSDEVSVALNAGETKVKVDLSAAEKAAINNKLDLPASAPAATKVVAVNTSKEQVALGIGNGLEISEGDVVAKLGAGLEISSGAIAAKIGDGLQIDNGTIKAKVGTGVEIDANGALSANIPDALVLPETAPADQKLVSINTSRQQTNLGIDKTLEVVDNILGVNALYLDATSISLSTWTAISKTVGEKISLKKYAYIYLYKVANSYSSLLVTWPSEAEYRTPTGKLEFKAPTSNWADPKVQAPEMLLLNIRQNSASTGDDDYYQIRIQKQSLNEDQVGPAIPFGQITGTAGTDSSGSTYYTRGSWKYRKIYYKPSSSDAFQLPIEWKRVALNDWYGEAKDPVVGKSYAIHITNGNGAYTVTELTDSTNIGNFAIYDSILATNNLGSFDVYRDKDGFEYIELSNAIKVYAVDGSDVETELTATLSDYKTGSSPVIKVLVKNDGTNRYIAGLYDDVLLKTSFAKPTGTVNKLAVKVAVTNNGTTYYLSPSILFAGSDISASVPTQYTGIVRSSVTSIDAANKTFLEIIGAPITFGSDATIEINLCLNSNIVNGMVAAA